MAAGAERELTHDELWDDSALVESWNEALEEYKKYHSLAARGEKVSKTQIPKKQQLPSKAAAMLNGTRPSPQSGSPVQASNSPPVALPGNFIGPAVPPTQVPAATVPPPPAVPSGSAAMPQMLLGATTLDENMKNMMMSWYYAGYHLGLYEGQQRVWAQWQEAQQQEAHEEDDEYEPQLERKQDEDAG